MKKLLIALLLFSANAQAERLGPDVTDYYLEPSIGTAITSDGISFNPSLFYVKYDIDFGIEGMVGSTNGLFLTSRFPLNNEFNLFASIGKTKYEQETRYGDYDTIPTTLSLGIGYQTENGEIVLKGLRSESSERFTTSSTSDCRPRHSHSKCEPMTTTQSHNERDTKNVLSIELRHRF